MIEQDRISPPKWPRRLLHWYCKPDLLEMIEGDIEEEFRLRYSKGRKLQAKWQYTVEVLRFFRPFAIRSTFVKNRIPMSINRNYLKVAFRSLKKDGTNSTLSVFGLMIAMLCTMVVYAVVDYELGYDSFHEKADRIYRISYDESVYLNSTRKLATVGPPLGPAIKAFYPEVEDAVRFRYSASVIVSYRDQVFYEDHLFYADPSIFNVFSYPLKIGDESTALKDKNSIVLTSEMALKYFGDENPLDKLISLNGELYKVTGVFDDIPTNRHMHFDFVRPFDAFEVPYGYPVTLDDWGWISFHTYVLLKPDADPEALERKLPDFAKTHFDEERISKFHYRVQPLGDIYFSDYESSVVVSGDRRYVNILISVGGLLMLLSIFNFTNIATAKSLTRASETGVRKTLGSSQKGLWWRYLIEPMMLSLLAVAISLVAAPYVLRFMESNFNMSINLDTELINELILWFVPLAMLIGCLAGLYPALVMSSFKPVSVLKGDFKVAVYGKWFRKALITLQFIITSSLLIGSFLINGQLSFMLDKDLGYDKERIGLLHMLGEVLERYYEPLKTRLMDNPYVEMVSVAGGRMDGESGSGPITIDGLEEPIPMHINAIGEDYFKLIGVKVIAGREFSAEVPYDSADGVILNRSAMEALGLDLDSAIGQHIVVSDQRNGHIMGVVEDFHLGTLHEETKPLVMVYPHTRLSEIYIRLKVGEAYDIVSSMEGIWKEVITEVPFDFIFLDDYVQALYVSDKQFAGLVKLFSWITVVVAILGLYGLIALICKFRMKEVGVRKILGASVYSVIITLSWSFISLIILANIISWPLVYWLGSDWLDGFAYQTPLSLGYFILGLAVTVTVAAITLIIQTTKTARTNPVNILKYE
ncbi:MAG: ABC transporter permease [Bacteroidota bacterium]